MIQARCARCSEVHEFNRFFAADIILCLRNPVILFTLSFCVSAGKFSQFQFFPFPAASSHLHPRTPLHSLIHIRCG